MDHLIQSLPECKSRLICEDSQKATISYRPSHALSSCDKITSSPNNQCDLRSPGSELRTHNDIAINIADPRGVSGIDGGSSMVVNDRKGLPPNTFIPDMKDVIFHQNEWNGPPPVVNASLIKPAIPSQIFTSELSSASNHQLSKPQDSRVNPLLDKLFDSKSLKGSKLFICNPASAEEKPSKKRKKEDDWQMRIFSTSLANKAAEAVISNKCSSILSHHANEALLKTLLDANDTEGGNAEIHKDQDSVAPVSVVLPESRENTALVPGNENLTPDQQAERARKTKLLMDMHKMLFPRNEYQPTPNQQTPNVRVSCPTRPQPMGPRRMAWPMQPSSLQMLGQMCEDKKLAMGQLHMNKSQMKQDMEQLGYSGVQAEMEMDMMTQASFYAEMNSEIMLPEFSCFQNEMGCPPSMMYPGPPPMVGPRLDMMPSRYSGCSGSMMPNFPPRMMGNVHQSMMANGSQGLVGNGPHGMMINGPQGMLLNGPPGMMGNGTHGMMGSGPHGMMGTAPPGLMGNGPPGMMGNGPSGMMGNGPPQGMGPNCPQGMMSNGPHGMMPNGPQGMIPNGPQGMMGNIPQGMVANSPQGMMANGPQGMMANGPQGMMANGPQGMMANGPQRMMPNGPQGMMGNIPQGIMANSPQGMMPNGPQGMIPNGPQGMMTNGPRGMMTHGPQGMMANVPPGMIMNGPQGMIPKGPPGMMANGPPGMMANGPPGMMANGPPGMMTNGPPPGLMNHPMQGVMMNYSGLKPNQVPGSSAEMLPHRAMENPNCFPNPGMGPNARMGLNGWGGRSTRVKKSEKFESCIGENEVMGPTIEQLLNTPQDDPELLLGNQRNNTLNVSMSLNMETRRLSHLPSVVEPSQATNPNLPHITVNVNQQPNCQQIHTFNVNASIQIPHQQQEAQAGPQLQSAAKLEMMMSEKQQRGGLVEFKLPSDIPKKTLEYFPTDVPPHLKDELLSPMESLQNMASLAAGEFRSIKPQHVASSELPEYVNELLLGSDDYGGGFADRPMD